MAAGKGMSVEAMNREARMRLVAALEGKAAHLTFEEAVRDFPESLMNTKPAHVPYTFWHQLEDRPFPPPGTSSVRCASTSTTNALIDIIACMRRVQMTIRRIPEKVHRRLREAARSESKSMNQVALDALERGLGARRA
jgi:hypothetical protein